MGLYTKTLNEVKINEAKLKLDDFIEFMKNQWESDYFCDDVEEYLEDSDEYEESDLDYSSYINKAVEDFKYPVIDFFFEIRRERDLKEFLEAWNEFDTKSWGKESNGYSNWDYTGRYDHQDFCDHILKKIGLGNGDGELIDEAVTFFEDIKGGSFMEEIDRSKLPLGFYKEMIDWWGEEDMFIKDDFEDGREELAEFLLTGDIDDDMEEYGNNPDIVKFIMKDVLDKMSDWKIITKYYWELRNLITPNHIRYALKKGTYKKDRDAFIEVVVQMKDAKDDGHPFREYGAAAVQDAFGDYEWNDEELNDLLQDKYELSKIDWEMPYDVINKNANSAEADHIIKQGPNYIHN